MSKENSGSDVLSQLAGLRRYALSLTRQADDAEDLVHDTLVRAYERRASFKNGGNVRAWLMSILHNTFIDGARRRSAEMRRDRDAAGLAETVSLPAQDGNVRLAQVRRAFAQLPEEQRAAMHLVALEGLSYQEAAQVLGVPTGTVMSRISRARETLRQIEAGSGAQPSHLKIVGGKDDRT